MRILKEQEEAAKIEEIIQENMQEEEITREDILTMYAHCNVIELNAEASQFVEER